MRFPTMSYVRPAKAQTSLHIHAVWSEPLLDKDIEALFNVAYNATDNISSQAILLHNNILTDTYLTLSS